jgi:hypothetical protein
MKKGSKQVTERIKCQVLRTQQREARVEKGKKIQTGFSQTEVDRCKMCPLKSRYIFWSTVGLDTNVKLHKYVAQLSGA